MYSSQVIVRSSSPSSPVHSHLPELNSVDAKSKPVKTLLKATGGCQVFPRFAVDEMEREPRSAMLATTSHSLVWGWSAGTISSLERDLILLFSIGPIKPTPADKIHFGRLSSLFAHCSSYIRPLSLMDFLMTENGLGFGTCWYNNYSISKKTGWPYSVKSTSPTEFYNHFSWILESTDSFRVSQTKIPKRLHQVSSRQLLTNYLRPLFPLRIKSLWSFLQWTETSCRSMSWWSNSAAWKGFHGAKSHRR